MKLTQRGKNLQLVAYTVVFTILAVLVWHKYFNSNNCVDKYTAEVLANVFLYGEGEEVDKAITAIYNNGGWEEYDTEGNVFVSFVCLDNEGLV
jgi:RsiW-degrading membrane proteinase PrsW (M82 family)